MIVSYKDREEDRRAGLDAGADYCVAKGSFRDEAAGDQTRRACAVADRADNLGDNAAPDIDLQPGEEAQ
ncbi:hypothetical protein BN2475_340062 [Paraburkholderia ribeironis]|uniref:Uncharacterized protein n=1 Tax=Paraburkholderia ribeironis TaxID=1247936 RepID=A0A1N7S3X8_9BURK|nr:hypothetical protein BN2475_340062 [Paraburkholderia ribeironis]